MYAEKWMKQLEMAEKVRRDLNRKEKAQAAEQEEIRQEAEKRAWMRELEQASKASYQLKGGRKK